MGVYGALSLGFGFWVLGFWVRGCSYAAGVGRDPVRYIPRLSGGIQYPLV